MALLDAIHQHHILRLGPAEYLQVQQLLEVRPDLSRAELQVALASLLATNRAQWQQIVGLFKEYYPEAAASDLSQPRPGPPLSGPVLQDREGLARLRYRHLCRYSHAGSFGRPWHESGGISATRRAGYYFSCSPAVSV